MKTQSYIRKMIFAAIFTALIAVGAFIKIPIPVIPITLQTLFVILSGMLLGAKWGAASAFAYLSLGLLGLPIFTMGGGIGYVLNPTFGYIIGFVFGSYVIGYLIYNVGGNISLKKLIFASFMGILVIYIFGAAYYYMIGNFVINSEVGLKTLFLSCFLYVIPGDTLVVILASFLGKRLIPLIKRYDM